MNTYKAPIGSMNTISTYSVRNRGIFVCSLLPTINFSYTKKVDSSEVLRCFSIVFGFLIWGYVIEIYNHRKEVRNDQQADTI